ncbi:MULTISPECIES: glycosyltransferase [unclassified Delftia]|uniref:glycosyltransferase n=1 Tax=unclassified Delftia TaxID=2613839 RepID=UPI0018FF68EA|nr:MULTISPECIES: glycosyltransferase [unclassified Delftia]MBK0111367.1 glycosyltransferase [Delftia sp. S65]MBK0116814.1 glycosyltransferase [Delftia sp. S67]MBK0128085.1 glycosyltransferase [Delftia sp. S66]
MANILMLCHDQILDRRVLAQAESLIAKGHSVRLLALALESETVEEKIGNGIDLVRIGLVYIVPENITYKKYISRQQALNQWLNRQCNEFPRGVWFHRRAFSIGSKLHWQVYRWTMNLRYRNRAMHDPLPFRSAFVSHAEKYQADLVQVHDLPALAAGSELAERWKVPLVYDAHELYPEQKSFSTVQRRICSEAEALYIKKASLVFAVNESIGEEMAKRYSISKPITLLNAIDPPVEFDPAIRYDFFREKLGIPAEKKILLFQGGFAPHRNLEVLIKAMTYVSHPDVVLVMMGFGDFGEFLKKKAIKLRLLGSRIYFLPAVSQGELLQHSASADIGIIPYPHIDLNSYYCTPNKLFEFIQAGLPILANDSPELNRFVKLNGFGYSAKMDSALDIAKAIDMAFRMNNGVEWRENIKRKRNDLAWKLQDNIYSFEMAKIFDTLKFSNISDLGKDF